MKRSLTTIIGFLLLSVTVAATVLADCPDQATAALAVVNEVCHNTLRNQACYGHAQLEAQPQPHISPEQFVFNAPGNQVDVASLRALRLLPMDTTTDVWGVALMKLQANLPDNTAENVTLLLFGDAHIENAAPPQTASDFMVSISDPVNVRSNASFDAGVIGTLQPGQIVTGIERVADNSWVRIQLPGTTTTGWVSADLVTGDIEALNVVNAFAPHYTPMQAFYFQSGSTDADCTEAANGLIIQTPEGVGKVRLWMNDVRLQIGSTVFFQATPGGDLIVRTLEGSALVETMGVTQNAVAGTQVRVKLDETLHAVTPPSIPEPYDLEEAQALPVEVLERPIEVAEPLTPVEIAAILDPNAAPAQTSVIADTGESVGQDTVSNVVDTVDQVTGNRNDNAASDSSTDNGTGDENNNDRDENDNGGGRPDCPGNSCNAPGHNKDNDNNNGGGRPDCPGNSCNAPGHNKDNKTGTGLLSGVVRLIRDVLD